MLSNTIAKVLRILAKMLTKSSKKHSDATSFQAQYCNFALCATQAAAKPRVRPYQVPIKEASSVAVAATTFLLLTPPSPSPSPPPPSSPLLPPPSLSKSLLSGAAKPLPFARAFLQSHSHSLVKDNSTACYGLLIMKEVQADPREFRPLMPASLIAVSLKRL